MESITNEEMKPGRWAKKYRAKSLLAQINDTLSRGGSVVVSTYSRATEYKAKHAAMFRLSGRGDAVLVQRGKSWDNIMYCYINFY